MEISGTQNVKEVNSADVRHQLSMVFEEEKAVSVASGFLTW